jgi:hypothetical protein
MLRVRWHDLHTGRNCSGTVLQYITNSVNDPVAVILADPGDCYLNRRLVYQPISILSAIGWRREIVIEKGES